MAIPSCPESLKAVAHYLKIADEHDSRDIVISYWCRIHALEVAMKLSADNKTPEINKFLLSVMDWLEKTKSQHSGNDGITSKMCAQATVENYALKLFKYADEQDRAENYGKNVVKAFYTAGILMDVLTSFDDLSEDIADKRKYAKWKAAYIHNCLKSGERPVPGPLGSNDDDDFTPVSKDSEETIDDPGPPAFGGSDVPTFGGSNIPPFGGTSNPSFGESNIPSFGGSNMPMLPDPPMNNANITGPPTWPMFPQQPSVPTLPYGGAASPAVTPTSQVTPPVVLPPQYTGTADLNAEQIQKAQKYCKWASSALNYDDIKTAVDSLQKALILLQTGKDSPE